MSASVPLIRLAASAPYNLSLPAGLNLLTWVYRVRVTYRYDP